MIFHDLHCPIKNDICRHCSNEGIRNRTRACRLDGKGEVIITQEVTFGLYCNNYGDWLRNMKECELSQTVKPAVVVDYREFSYSFKEGQSGQTTLGL